MRRTARGLGALLGLLLGLVGIPFALLALGADLRPGSWAPTELVRVLLQPDDGRILVALLTVVGWLAWLVFAASVGAELLALISHRRIRWRIPGLAGPQRLAASLLIAVIALAPTAPVAQAEPLPASPSAGGQSTSPAPFGVDQVAPSTPTTTDPAPAAPAAAGQVSTPQQETTPEHKMPQQKTPQQKTSADGKPSALHRVQPGDDLWSLAERYYDDGREWRKIAKANGHLLTGGPDRLTVGWELTIPDVGKKPAGDRAAAAPATAGHGTGAAITVSRGDTLSSIAATELGGAAEWPKLFRANRGVLDDPDELAIGMELELPTPAYESPGRSGTKAESSERATDASRRSTPETAGQEAAGQEAAGQEAAGSHADSDDLDGGRARQGTDAQTGSRAGTAAVPPASPASPTASAVPSVPETTPAVGPAVTVGSDPSEAGGPDQRLVESLGAYAGIGGLLAAGLLGGLAFRRRLQLQSRPVGRRILQPDAEVALAEVALGTRQRPLDLDAVDTVVRGIGVHSRHNGQPLPRVSLIRLDADGIEVTLADPPAHRRVDIPLGFVATPDGWQVAPSDVRYLGSVPGVESAARPYPVLVELGRDAENRSLLANLEELGLLSLVGETSRALETLSAFATELAFAPGADELVLTVVGDRGGLPDALDKYNVTATEDVDALLSHLELRARAQREQQPDGPAGHQRIDPDLNDPWVPEVVLVRRPLTTLQQRRFVTLVGSEPRPTIAIVVAGEVPDAPWSLRFDAEGAVLEPPGERIFPRSLPTEAEDSIVELVATTGSLETTPAPWWADDDPPDSPPGEDPPGDLAFLARRSAGWATDSDDENGQTMAQNLGIGRDVPPDHPVLLMLGPIELVGAQGTLPPRAAKQCLEYCGWLLEHPGTTAQAMGSALMVAEGTRRSNMSRLRSWLGADDETEAYLPDAYSGRIMLHAAVSSDWQRLQILTAAGVNRTSDSGLRAALELVRGAPLADAAPGQWHWAEELRTDMISVVRDIGVELGTRANEAGEVDLARWAAARALAAAPGDELLMATRIRTEHLAGNRAETERLTLQLAAQARALGTDLETETVELLQQVMEGQVRARMA